MPREKRTDYSGAWHHVMNRGIAKRTVFERKEHVDQFLAKLREAVERREFKVHSLCVLTTHFHLLVESLGKLSEGMRRVENEYVRWFNIANRRDGSLFRGRFNSKLVKGTVYRRNVVRYIDQNPVMAGLADAPEAYPYGSAAMQRSLPSWLCKDWLRDELAPWLRLGHPWHLAYREAFGQVVSADHAHIVERSLSKSSGSSFALEDLIGAAPDRVRDWMRRKTRLADGMTPGQPVLGPESVRSSVEKARESEGLWRLASRTRHRDGWRVAHAGLLRDACAMSMTEIARELGIAVSTAYEDCRAHRARSALSDYADRLSRVAASALELCHGR